MTISYNLTGKARTALAKAISQELNTEATYIKGKTHAYIIGEYTLDRNGTLTGPENANLVTKLISHKFEPITAEYDTKEVEDFEEIAPITDETATATQDAPESAEFPTTETEAQEQPETAETLPESDTLTIEMPLDGFNPDKLDNLCKMVTAKEALLKAALGADDLPIQVTDTVRFPWFNSTNLQNDEVEAYTNLISLLCETAKEKKRVTAKVGEMPDNPKYAFRCWLLSLGMIGKEYQTSRKVLLSKLDGCSAWKVKPEAVAATTEA